MPDSLGGTGDRGRSNCDAPTSAPVVIEFEKTKFGDWAHGLIGAGRRIATFADEPPTTLALSLPTLDYGAPLVAAGYVAARAERLHVEASTGTSGVTAEEKRFQQLCAMKPGSPISMKLRTSSGTRTVLGSFVEVREVHGEKYASIKYQNATKSKGGEARELINLRNVHRVLFAVGDQGKVADRKVGAALQLHRGLATGFLSSQEALPQLLLRSGTDCLIIGVVKAIGAELWASGFAAQAHANERRVSGSLQDVVRAADLLGAGEASQTKLLSVQGEMGSGASPPRVVIFRGASAYVRQAENFSRSHHIVLLSPTEPEFDVAVGSLNAAYFERADDFPDPNIVGSFGITAMGFARLRREPQ